MRRLVTGIDGSGRSCLVEETPIAPMDGAAMAGVASDRVFATTQAPPPPRPSGHGGVLPFGPCARADELEHRCVRAGPRDAGATYRHVGLRHRAFGQCRPAVGR